ncbi:MAG TPA: GAF and ANTAR domain-containing protein [Egibacteraceae bacterium]|nr:GAF and ANTAR domain-containing protein [Egibacteraceae bacterium]
MVDYDLLSRELAALAAGLGPESDLHEGLHQLSLTATEAMDLGGAGVTLQIPGAPTSYLAAADQRTLYVERKQDQLQQGACIDAIEASQFVAVDDLTVDAPWPEFTPVVLEAGFRAIAGVPITFQGLNIGAVNLYSVGTRMWTTQDRHAGHLIANMAAGYLINHELLRTAQTLAAQLQHALDSRVIIEQAKGILAERHKVRPDDAFEAIRAFARRNRLKIHELATQIVTGAIDIPQPTSR